MIRLKSMALLSFLCLVVAVFAGCYKQADLIIEIGEEGPFKPRFVANYDIMNLDICHVYGWPQRTPSTETPDGEPVKRSMWVWEIICKDGSQSEFKCNSVKYGELPLGYEGQGGAPLETGKLYRVEAFLDRGGHPSARKAFEWFCILEDESGDARLIELTFRASRHSDLDPPFNEVRLELEEGTRKILKIIPVE